MLLDYDNEEEARLSLTPKLVSEIVGISEWEGQSRTGQSPNGLLLVTLAGGTYYLAAQSIKDRDEWLLHVRRAMECTFANDKIKDYRPSKIIQTRPRLFPSKTCAKTKVPLSSGNAVYCRSCGLGFASSELVQEMCSFLQIGGEENERCCSDCRSAQICIIWLKSLNYVHLMTLHDMTPRVNDELRTTFKATFKLRRRLSTALDMAGQLLDQNSITAEEFRDLQQVDRLSQLDKVFEASEQLGSALEVIGDDMHMIISLLLRPSTTEAGGRVAYYELMLKILRVADREPELIDFYLPQLLQIYMLEAAHRSPTALCKVDLLQQMILVLAQKYPALALRISWLLTASASDYDEKKTIAPQYAACVCLLLQLEMAVTGIVSSIADVTSCRVMSQMLRPASHQKQELGCELGGLFLIRRRLQEVFDEEAVSRRARIVRLNEIADDKILGASESKAPNSGSGAVTAESSGVSSTASVESAKGSLSNNTGEIIHFHNPKSCVELWHQLGVGQATSSPVPSLNHSRNNTPVRDPATVPPKKGPSKAIGTSPAPESSMHRSDESEQFSDQFNHQLDFIDHLSTFVDSLRNVDRSVRIEALRKELARMNEHSSNLLGWDPCVGAGEPGYRIVRLIVEDCRVFRTKARAPSLIVCEVVRQDLDKPDFLRRWRQHVEADNVAITPIKSEGVSIKTTEELPLPTDYAEPVPTSSTSDSPDSPKVTAPGRRRMSVDHNPADSTELGLDEIAGLVDSNIQKAIADIHKAHSGSDHGVEDILEPLSTRSDTSTYSSISEVSNTFESPRPPVHNNSSNSQHPHTLHPQTDRQLNLVDKKMGLLRSHTTNRVVTAVPKPVERVGPIASIASAISRPVNSIIRKSRGQVSFQETDAVDSASPRLEPPSSVRRAISDPIMSPSARSPPKRPLASVGKINSTNSDRNHAGEGMEAIDAIYDIGEMLLRAPAKLISSRNKSSSSIGSSASADSDESVKTGGVARSQSDNRSLHREDHTPRRLTLASLGFAGTSGTQNSSRDLQGAQSRSNTARSKSGDVASQLQPPADAGKSIGSLMSNLTAYAVPRRRSATSLLPLNRKSTTLLNMGLLTHSTSSPSLESMTVESPNVLGAQRAQSGASLAGETNGLHPNASISHILNSEEDYDIIVEDDANGIKKVHDSAKQLLDAGMIDQVEYEQLVKSDSKYRHETAREDVEIILTKVETAFGESWRAKRERVLGSRFDKIEGENGDKYWSVWDLRSFIVKSNDDLRQEVCCLQLMKLCKEIFEDFGLANQLWLKPYKIVSTGSRTGIVQVLPDTLSLDALKKTRGFVNLPTYFKATYGASGHLLYQARKNFVASLAAYSLFCYLLFIKDRHNGNILIDIEGHIIHIDFGFMLSIAPGGYLSLETAPFKLTEEMVEVLGGLESKMFGEFVKAFTAGFLALRANAESLISNLQVLAVNSPYPCFYGKDTAGIIDKMRARFRTDLTVKEAVEHCLDLITSSYGHYGTKQYDSFQYYTNGILA